MNINKLAISVMLGLSTSVAGTAFAACTDDHPMEIVASIGGGQNSSVNNTLTAKFEGYFTTTNGLTNRGRNTVKVCPGTTVDYLIESTVGATSAVGSRGYIAPIPDCGNKGHYGTLVPGDKLSCNNANLGGSDTDTFTVKVGK